MEPIITRLVKGSESVEIALLSQGVAFITLELK